MSSRMTVIGRVSGRARRTVEQKLLMLRDAFGSGACVHTAMELHEVSTGQHYTWRHQAMSGELTGTVAPVLPLPMAQAVPCFAERSLRAIAVGRINWLGWGMMPRIMRRLRFAGSNTGGARAAAIYTVIETCKMNGVEPQANIADVIAKIAADWPASRWGELMPWNWKPDQTLLDMAA